VIKAYCILGWESIRILQNFLQVIDSNKVGNIASLSLQICDIETPALILKASI